MRKILCLLIALCSVAAVPLRTLRQAPQAAPLFARQALFIPDDQMPHDFDATHPIAGAFFVPTPRKLHDALSPAPASVLLPSVSVPLPFVDRLTSPTMEPLVTTTENTHNALPTAATQHRAPNTLSALPVAALLDRTIDTNGDGSLSLAEVQYAAFVHHGLSGSVVENMFKQVDANADGTLDATEFDKIRPLVLEKAENAALRYMQSVDTDKNKLLSLAEAQHYLLKEYGIGSRDVERIWRLVVPDVSLEMDANQFSKLRRRIRGMTIRLARQIMKIADTNGDGHISLEEAQAIAFEQEGIGAGDVTQMMASVDDNMDGELNAPEFADFERIVRSRAVETSRKALRVVDADGSNTLTMDEAKRIAFEHYGFDENVLLPFFDQADENEDGQLDSVEFAGFRSVIRSRAVKNALKVMQEVDLDGDGLVSLAEAQEKTKSADDMEAHETQALFNIADQNKSGKLDKVELADFIRLVRLSAIKFATDHFKEFDANGDRLVTVDELAALIQGKYGVPYDVTQRFFDAVDIDHSQDLIPAEIVDFRHEIRKYVADHPAASQEVTSSGEVRPPTADNRLPPRHETSHEQKSLSDVTRTRPPVTKTTTTSTTSTTIQEEIEKSTESTEVPSTRRKLKFHRTTTTTAAPESTSAEIDVAEASGDPPPTEPTQSELDAETLTTKKASRQPRVWRHHTAKPTGTVTSTTTTSSTTALPSTNSDVEYEIVEVEVDENGNEIAHEKEKKERKRLIQQQKKEMNIPESTEVEYVEAALDPTTKSPEDYEVVEYVEEEEPTNKKSN